MILINRRLGGLGDILVHRQIFKDVAEAYGAPLHFSCPSQYLPAVSDHPHLAEALDAETVDPWDYPLVFDTTRVCVRTEVAHLRRGFPPPQRSDIWAAQCGVTLTDRDPHFRFTPAEVDAAKGLLDGVGCVFCPTSAVDIKDLSQAQRDGLFAVLDAEGLRPRVLHHQPLGLPSFPPMTVREWMAVIAHAPLVVSVDTAAVHMAGLSRRPMVSLFWVHPGKQVTKYYDGEVVQVENRDQIDNDRIMKAVKKVTDLPK